ncbi:leucine-rich repeat-containing protein 75A-like isoform X2 [Electrophorus electricus]|uniref:leucine-rich repeat-containing protein 75A-like isoform X2 n=1 Tax=Electrophorus electricus TaxID=8005 RepID=UPI0015CFA8DE|nr:leucine-rich repeat-containing protein 75A-like isoform X2 [Electrophorus electricus]
MSCGPRMGARQSKGQEAGSSPLQGVWTRAQSSLLFRLSSCEREESPAAEAPPPYRRRVCMIQEMLHMIKEGRHEEASEQLRSLRQEADSLSAMEKVCRQLTYHLSPHPRWRRQGLLKGKPPASLKAFLAAPPAGGGVDLSGFALSLCDAKRLASHLHRHASHVHSVELAFTGLTDDALLLLLPTLAGLPALQSLALNGNRLTRAVLRHLTDALRDPGGFPALAWVDLGNNVDIFSLPQAFVVSLRKRCPKQGSLPTIQEQGEATAGEPDERHPGWGSSLGGWAGCGACGSTGLDEDGEDERSTWTSGSDERG